MRAFLFAMGVLALVLAGGCHRAGCPEARLVANYGASYSVNPAWKTPSGIAVDPSGLPINPARIDRIFHETETCLAQAFGSPAAKIPLDVGTACSCGRPDAGWVIQDFQLPLARGCLVVKVAADWHLNPTKDQQLLPLYAGNSCKGGSGDCYWRAAVQDDFTLITTPSMYLLKDVIVRVTTGCANPWGHPKMAACVNPSTGPLDDGTGP